MSRYLIYRNSYISKCYLNCFRLLNLCNLLYSREGKCTSPSILSLVLCASAILDFLQNFHAPLTSFDDTSRSCPMFKLFPFFYFRLFLNTHILFTFLKLNHLLVQVSLSRDSCHSLWSLQNRWTGLFSLA